jgi:hypothetical protein
LQFKDSDLAPGALAVLDSLAMCSSSRKLLLIPGVSSHLSLALLLRR